MSDANSLPADAVPLAGSVPLAVEVQPAQLKVEYKKPPASINFTLPDGKQIRMAPPAYSLAEPLTALMSGCKLEGDAFERERLRIKSLLYISHVNGEQELKLSDSRMRAALEQKLGDQNLDAIFVIWIENWPPTDPGVIEVARNF